MQLTNTILVGKQKDPLLWYKFLKSGRYDFRDYEINIKVKNVLTSHSVFSKTSQHMKMPQLVKILEYGHGNIPPRPFIRQAVASCIGDVKRIVSEAYTKKLNNGSYPLKRTLLSVGDSIVAQILETIRVGTFKPIAPKTMKNRISAHRRFGDTPGSDPLIDWGYLSEKNNAYKVFYSTVTSK